MVYKIPFLLICPKNSPKNCLGVVKVTKFYLMYQYNWSASTIDKNIQKIIDDIHQYLIQNMTKGIEVCPVI